MKLLIISNMAHYLDSTGKIVGWGPTVREIDSLTRIFEEICHIGCLHATPAPSSALPYTSDRVHLVPLPPAGGERLHDKYDVLKLSPLYLRTILTELHNADVVHVRCPANISLLAIVSLAFVRHPNYRWVKYAGNWKPGNREDFSYTFQRWWLSKNIHHGVVSINGHWPKQPEHLYSFLNPSLSDIEVIGASQIGKEKRLCKPYQFLFVGRLETAKGVGRILDITHRLKKDNLPFECHMIGDGPERLFFEEKTRSLGLDDCVHYHGWQSKDALAKYYARAHFLLLPTVASEGWPKVLSEAMAYGVVPLAGAVSSIPQILDQTQAGLFFRPEDLDSFTQAIRNYVDQPDAWQKAKSSGLEAARRFTYTEYIQSIRQMFLKHWGITLPEYPI